MGQAGSEALQPGTEVEIDSTVHFRSCWISKSIAIDSSLG